jgi:hypothetical protein
MLNGPEQVNCDPPKVVALPALGEWQRLHPLASSSCAVDLEPSSLAFLHDSHAF